LRIPLTFPAPPTLSRGIWCCRDKAEAAPDIERKHKQFYPTTDGQLWVGAYGTPADSTGKPVHGVRVAGWLDLDLMPLSSS